MAKHFNGCPPSHVVRLIKLQCPDVEIRRITGYSQSQIDKLRNKLRKDVVR